MRCPQCNKFAPLTFEEPEVESDPEINDGTVTAQVRIYRNSECCGEEMKEAHLDLEAEVPPEILADHDGDKHELSVEADDPEQIEEGGGRYAKSYFGASIQFRVMCSCQKEPIYEGEMSDKVAASHMDEMC